MRRPFADVVFDEEFVGSEASHRAAAALADRLDPGTIIALTDAMAFLERCGGQFHVVTLRRKVDFEGRSVAEDEPGEWRTQAFHFEYESRDAKVTLARPPAAVAGVPIVDFSEPPTLLETEEDPAPDVESDLRDEIEAEAAEMDLSSEEPGERVEEDAEEPVPAT